VCAAFLGHKLSDFFVSVMQNHQGVYLFIDECQQVSAPLDMEKFSNASSSDASAATLLYILLKENIRMR
jgi:hypothetical protein